MSTQQGIAISRVERTGSPTDIRYLPSCCDHQRQLGQLPEEAEDAEVAHDAQRLQEFHLREAGAVLEKSEDHEVDQRHDHQKQVEQIPGKLRYFMTHIHHDAVNLGILYPTLVV